MTRQSIDKLLDQEEGVDIEFKESYFELNKSTFDSICAFLNRKGGHLLLGVTNEGKVEGVLDDKVTDLVNAIVTNANNPLKLHPVIYLSPEVIDYEGKKIIYVWVPESSQVHQTAGKIFDRNQDGDFEITGLQHLIRQLHLRKQQSYTENRIYPYLKLSDFRADLFPKVRQLARSQRPDHPWLTMNDEALLRSAGLFQVDYQTGREGFTLAAALLLGKDEVIQSIVPYYKTDAICRIVNADRYDDRDYITTNLVDAYERLMDFIAKHLPEKFYQEGTQRVNLRNRLFHEVVANLLVHREYANAFPAKLVIEKGRVFTENWNKPHINGIIDPSNFTPFPKNPVIARFFKEIGRAEELGSGVRNTNKYGVIYSNGKVPIFEEGDVFVSTVFIDAAYHRRQTDTSGTEASVVDSTDIPDDTAKVVDTVNDTVSDGVSDGVIDGVSDGVKNELVKVVQAVIKEPGIVAEHIARSIGKAKPTTERYIRILRTLQVLEFKGAAKTGGYYLTESFKEKIKPGNISG